MSTWLNGGVPPADVAAWAGHSVEILLKIYAKCLDGGTELLGKRVTGGAGPPVRRRELRRVFGVEIRRGPARAGKNRTLFGLHGLQNVLVKRRIWRWSSGWCPRQDSNLRPRLRRAVLYPLSYGGSETGKG